ncbi:tumor necrosis factor receptor superfamily member 17 [Suncus etruscus]|uniref:tumor necrosis factor receptor superfamily member 17 n=1 Tax=Suncus etruscus TaxID=109475 RepID=UPI0021101BA1|nr:tumor necrosis factor receptor superfamily member 17 [Suncus etruscus]
MAQQCFQNEYFDSLLNSCKPCHLRCSNTPPLPCQHHCNAMKGTNALLWACLGLSVILSLTVFVMFLLRKLRSESLLGKPRNTGSALGHLVKVGPEHKGLKAEMLPPQGGLKCIVECSCNDCAMRKPQEDHEPFFPLPVMEEGTSVSVSGKISTACCGLPGAKDQGFGEICIC